MQRLFPVVLSFLAFLIVGCAVPADGGQTATDYAHVDSGTTVAFTSEGCNPSPYDVRGAIGDGEHLSYPQAPPNSFILDLGQEREIRSIELDRRYANKGIKHFRLSFGVSQDALDEIIDVEDFGDSKYWYRILKEPLSARFVKFESLGLEDIDWTVLNRISLYGTTRIPRLAEQWGDRYGWLGPRMQRIAQDAAPLNITDQIQVADSAYTCANFADLLASDEPISEKQWQQMADRWDVLLQGAYDAEAAVSFAKARQRSGEAGYLIETVGEMQKVFRDICPKGKDTLELCCAKNEWQSGQIALSAVDADLKDVEVSWDRLRGPATLEKGSLDCQLVCYVKTEQAPYLTHHIGWWPDGLSPMARFDLPAGEVQPVWITAKIPENAPAGTYSSTITINPANRPATTIPLEVTVWDFVLPTQIALDNIFTLPKLLIEAWYDEHVDWEEDKYRYYDFWLDHRLNPTSLYGNMIPEQEDVQYCLDRGMNTFVMRYIYSGGNRAKEAYFQRSLDVLAEWDPVLAEHDAYDKAIVYLADEPSNRDSIVNEINRRSSIIHERFPGMQRLLVYHQHIAERFEGNVDIWCPIVGVMDPANVPVRHGRGEQMWWYTVGTFFDLDRPAAEARSMPWLTWKHDLDGMLYWNIMSSWRGENNRGRFHPQPGEVMWDNFTVAGHGNHNGIGNMVYPGPDGEPWSTIRLEILREGMEDYEYMALLDAAAPDDHPYRKLLSVPEDIDTKYLPDHAGTSITERRERIGEALNELLGGRE